MHDWRSEQRLRTRLVRLGSLCTCWSFTLGLRVRSCLVPRHGGRRLSGDRLGLDLGPGRTYCACKETNMLPRLGFDACKQLAVVVVDTASD